MEDFSKLYHVEWAYCPHFPFSGRNLVVCAQQPSTRQHQIVETEQCEQLCRVLDQPFVSRFAMTKQILHHMERMLDLRMNDGLRLFDLLQQLAECVSGKVLR